MSDNATTGGTYTFATYNDGTAHHPGNVLEFVTGGSAGAWTTQKVDSTHGLPVAGVGTFAVSAASLPLPTGASSESTLSTLNSKVTACNTGAVVVASGALTANVGTTNGLALDATLTGGTQKSKLVDSGGTNVATVSSGGALKVDGSAATQPVSGNVGTLPLTSGGLSVSSAVSGASNNATVAKASAGQVYAIVAVNLSASPRWMKFYDTASTPTPGSTTVLFRVGIPGNTTGAGVAIPVPPGVQFSTGIAYAVVTGIADSDNTSTSANDLAWTVFYK